MNLQRPTTVQPEKTTTVVSPPLRDRVYPIFWAAQGCGLALITFTSFFPSWFHFQEYFFFVLLVLAVGAVWVKKEMPFTRTPLDLPLFLFAAWVLVTVPFSTDPAYSFTEWRKFCGHVLVFYWAVLVLRTWRDDNSTRSILWAIVAGATGVAAYALIDFVERGGTWRDRVVRAVAPSSDYNWLTTYMVLAIPMLLFAVLSSRDRLKRLFLSMTVGLAFLAQVFSYTRAGWLGLVAEGVAFGLFTGRRRLIIWVLAGTVAAGLGFALASKSGYQRETIDPWTFSARLAVWQLGFRDVATHPIVGVGYGNDTFVKLHPAYALDAQKEKTVQDLVLPAMHSTFMMVAVGSGVPALAFFVWVFVRIIKALVQQRQHPKASEEQGLLIALAVVITGFAVRNSFDYMFAGSLAYLFWILVAMGICTVRTKSLA